MSEMSFTPWYKQFWPWFILTPLLFTVAVGITMLTISIKVFDGTVSDTYYKDGLAVNQVLARDHAAKTLGVEADMTFTDQEVSLQLNGLSSQPASLALKLINPTRARQDLAITLEHQGNYRYVGTLPHALQYEWDLELQPAGKVWRLTGRASFPAHQTIKLSAVQ
ncbi:hypothetical protein BFW38_11355 [Terasakiispira papahanaumokuakeensis]|uniref:Nitrogen fixation protein FixH n=1 Tax=Terasakiispira papahanaumokuakeensis TaxID=197479 RepID=A0A1E2VAP6_9GAMM|nr:FixH family protein [Terasakiispira papahanaumokuakeensis]ODC04044.1 hypothetical protein BFW38_11355 [Terasakiispira papahanaumokuakeensis]